MDQQVIPFENVYKKNIYSFYVKNINVRNFVYLYRVYIVYGLSIHVAYKYELDG